MRIFPLAWPDEGARLRKLCSFSAKGVRLEIGTGFLQAGTRMPDTGVSAHDRREITLILDGDLTTRTGGDTRRLGKGDVITIPAHQPQSSMIHKDTHLIYIFFGE